MLTEKPKTLRWRSADATVRAFTEGVDLNSVGSPGNIVASESTLHIEITALGVPRDCRLGGAVTLHAILGEPALRSLAAGFPDARWDHKWRGMSN
jgi:hypothetical protein